MSAGAVIGVAVCALAAAVLGELLKRSNKDYAILLTAAGAVLAVSFVLRAAEPLIEKITGLAGGGELLGLCLPVMLKAVGLTIIGQLAAHVCKDAGESALAFGVELATKAAVLAAAMPVVSRLFEYLKEIMEMQI